jgi:hypothetical protein
MDEKKIEPQPGYDALYAFDQEHDIQPASVVAERIAKKHGFPSTHEMVDDIHYAIEDAWELGQMRGRLIPAPRCPQDPIHRGDK